MNAQMISDSLGGVLCLLISASLFLIHVVSSPKRKGWASFPAILRGAILLSGSMFMLRGVGLLSADSPFEGQHIPPIGLLTTISLAALFCGLAGWITSRHLPDHLWDKLAWAESRAHADPTNVIPLVLTREDIVKVAESKGISVANPRG